MVGAVTEESRPKGAGMGIGNEGPLPLPRMALGSGSSCPPGSMCRFRRMSRLDRVSVMRTAIDEGYEHKLEEERNEP